MKDWIIDSTVSIYKTKPTYSAKPPFHPISYYPEYPFVKIEKDIPNYAYDGVREALHYLHLDEQHYGSKQWNPLSVLVAPGDTVVLKPNLICEGHSMRPDEWQQVITHGSIIRAVLDYVFTALKGSGRVIVCDGPQTDSNFEAICRRNGLYDIISFYKAQGLNIQLLDLRSDRWFQKGDVIYKRIKLSGDPKGYTSIDLGQNSEFMTYKLSGHFYGGDYNIEETKSFHLNGHHKYILCRSVMDADVVINLPKMKTHKKTGVTLSLKNIVGINGYRNCLPHHTVGTPDDRGDEFTSSSVFNKFQSKMTVKFKKLLTALGGKAGVWARLLKQGGLVAFGDNNQVVRSGNWYGNDTAWRMVLDLNKALFYFDGEGKPRSNPLKYMTIVDGIIAGDGNGPVSPDPLPAGLIIAGFNPVAVDTICTILMGFDYNKIPLLACAWDIQFYPLINVDPTTVSCKSNISEWNGYLHDLENSLHLGFKPHFGWKNHIERK